MSKLPWPEPKEGDFTIQNFIFQVGSSLPKLKIHYRTLGSPNKDSNGKTTNAVLIMHGTTGNGANFFRLDFAGKLFNKGQLLDDNEYFIVLVDGIGHGGSSKPSDSLRASFPRYGYSDMVRADYMLLTEHLGVNHLRLVMGTSMGGSKCTRSINSHCQTLVALHGQQTTANAFVQCTPGYGAQCTQISWTP